MSETQKQPELIGKVIFKGKITLLTGLHIGGSKSSLDIGGIDLNVVKTPKGLPFIPGSSLKGKLRSLLAKLDGSPSVEEDTTNVIRIFGAPGDDKIRSFEHLTRIYVRDADLDEPHFDLMFGKKDERRDSMETDFTVAKYENTIDRLTGTAKHPRQIERVPAGGRFNFEMVYDIYNDHHEEDDLKRLRLAMQLLELDYLGGQGSRGYGKIKFQKVQTIDGKQVRTDGHEEIRLNIDKDNLSITQA
jgi:CRISPR-associated protein Csm3